MNFIIISSLIILAISLFFFFRSYRDHKNLIDAQLNLAAKDQRIKSLENEQLNITKLLKEDKQDAEFKLLGRLARLEEEKQELQEKLTVLNKTLAGIEATYEAQQQKLTEQKEYVNELQIRFKTEFENVANQVLKAKAAEFTETNRTNLDLLLNPLKENIKAFEEKVEKVYKSESDERNVLKGEITKMMELNKQISDDTSNLTKALKGDNKKQGNWGEMVLSKLLEGSGLLEGVNYTKQIGHATEEGGRVLPDIILNLPDKKHIVIDSKVSLLAYERLVCCEDDAERAVFTKGHINSIKNHISGLSNKNYQDLYSINSPEFVLLFIPIESSFAIAVQHDQDLFDFAWNKRVVIVTPSTLLATLKTVASIWKQEQQTRNAIDIATKAGQLYDKFVGFVTDLQKVGESLDKSQKTYGEAMSKLTTGSGNLVNRVESLRKLGAKTSKVLDHKLLED